MSDEAGNEVVDPRDLISPWVPMTDPRDLKYLGKLTEELSECISAVSRCLIQGIDEKDPESGKRNKQWLEEEIADVEANLELVKQHFFLNRLSILTRGAKKIEGYQRWHDML